MAEKEQHKMMQFHHQSRWPPGKTAEFFQAILP
jgi:hypothetical protein